MDIEIMHEFVVFSRYLNFSKAAGQLNLAQPTLSSHIAAMEKELGFKLVQRGKNIGLTPAGKRFCANCERIVEDYSATVTACRELAKLKAGSLVFERPIHQGGIDREFDHLLLLFQERNPAIAISNQESTDISLREILQSGSADIAFIFNGSVEIYDDAFAASLCFVPAPVRARGPYYLWVDSSHHLASKESIGIEELGGDFERLAIGQGPRLHRRCSSGHGVGSWQWQGTRAPPGIWIRSSWRPC